MKTWASSKRVKLVAAGCALGIVVLGALDQPPPYVGRAAFSIDWEYTPTLSLDKKKSHELQMQARKEVREALTGSWPSSEQIHLLETAGRFPPSGLRAPKITVADQGESLTVVTLEIASATPDAARAMTRTALDGARRLTSDRIRLRGAEASIRSLGKVDDIRNRQERLRQEAAAIYRDPPLSAEDRIRLNEIDESLRQLEWGQAESGLTLLFNGSKSLFGPELPIPQQPTVLKSPRHEHWIGVVVMALFTGALAGGITHFLEKRRSKPVSPVSPPPLPPPLPPQLSPPLPPRIH